jgi:hypothetical protein
VVCLPEGVYYGHVEAAEAADLADEFARGELSLEHYRGRSCYPRAAQVAEYFLRRETGIRRIDAFRLLDTKRPVPDHWRVRFAGTIDGRVYTIEFRALESLHQPLTCGSESDSPVRQYYLIDCTSGME